jgi:hypothetical protein
MTSWQPGVDPGAAFALAYEREFGFVLQRPVVVDDLRVRATGRAASLPTVSVRPARMAFSQSASCCCDSHSNLHI